MMQVTKASDARHWIVRDNGGMPTPTELQILLRHPVEFVVAPEPGECQFIFHAPQGDVAASPNEAVGPLSGGIRALNAHPTARAWAAPAILALRLMASGSLGSPSPHDQQQLLDAGRSIGQDPADGQAQVRAFLASLLVDAPAVATTPQRGHTPDQPKPRIDQPRVFMYRLVIEFLKAPLASSVATVSLRVRPTDRSWGEVNANDLWSKEHHHFGPVGREATALMLGRLGATWTPALRLLPESEPAADGVGLTMDELAELTENKLSVPLMANRVDVTWPAELRRDVQSTAVVSRVDPGNDRDRAFTRHQVFRLDWSVSVGGHVLTRAELDELARSHSGLLKIRDDWVLVQPQQLEHIRNGTGEDISPIEALRATVTGSINIDGRTTSVQTVGWLEGLRERLAAQHRDIVPGTQPATLAGELRDYQLQGLRWMSQLVDLGLGGILADDMGLGKTLMLISLHLQRDAAAPTLVVCPASVLATWEREIARFAPGENVVRYHGPVRSLDGVKDGFVVTTYATMRSSVELLAESDWGLVVADEAQHVKNASSGTAQALRRIGSDARMALTGTPVENNLSELWAILDWTTPGLLGTREQFRRRWSRPIEQGYDDDVARELAALIRPFVLRRRKTDPGIAPELPAKIETDHRVPLTREQIGLYEAVARQAMDEIENTSGIKRRGLVVRLLTQLKQICNHPAQFLRQSDGKLAGRSGKLLALDELIEEILAEGSSTLIFTQYAQMGHLLTRHFLHRNVDHQFLHGGTTVSMREQLVRRFQDGEFGVFVLSLKAAGTGLNLTQADHVIHFDRWWNPAVEDQATDRAHRIGQTRAVHVHRLIAEGTIEESIAELIAAKRTLAEAVVNSGETALTELTDTELAALISLRR